MKQLFLLLTAALFFVTFNACDKADDDQKKLINSVWIAKSDNGVVFTLSFVNENTCRIMSSSNTGLYDSNILTFSYQLHSEIHSWPGHFGIFSTDDDHLTISYYGFIEGRKITLQPAKELATEYPVFQKKD